MMIMKRVVFFMVLAVWVSGAAQDSVNLGLIPTPQRVERGKWTTERVDLTQRGGREGVELTQRGGREDPERTQRGPREGVDGKRWGKRVRMERVESLPVEANMEQAYQLVIEPKRVTLRYTHEEGRRNGVLTLEQLCSIYSGVVPCCTITDWPAFRVRGWMDDISRGPVTHEAYRSRQWETLHGLKYNLCHYYTEHTLYQSEFPDLAPAYAACRRHPDEVINLQLFAHAEKTLRNPFYEHLKDSRANFNPDASATYDFLHRRVAEAYRQNPGSPYFIINCDETEQLGTGRARGLVGRKGAEQVYVDFINRCYEIVKEEGERHSTLGEGRSPQVAMWGDIVGKNPEMMRQLPKDMVYIMWAYEPIDSFRHLIRPFKEQANPFWVAASTGHSGTMTSTPQRYVKNIANLFRDGWRDGAEGAMLTCWDDNGEALFDNSWHAHYWAAEMAWNPIKTDDPEELRRRERQFNENYERLFYGERGRVRDLYTVGAMMYDGDVADWYTSAALLEPLLNFNPDNVSDAMSDRCSRVIRKLAAMDKEIDSAANPHAHYTVMRIRQTVLKSVLRKMIYHQLEGRDGTMRERLRAMAGQYMASLTDLKREYLRLWDQENGDYERYVVMNRYDALAREILDLDRTVFFQSKRSEQGSPMVELRTLYGDRPIYYTLDGSEPDSMSVRYEGPFALDRSATIKAVSYNKYGEGVVTERYLLSHKAMGAKVKLNTQYSTYKAIYSGGGPEALVDGQYGSRDTYADGHWQGYWGDSVDVTMDFGARTDVSDISMRFMQNTFDWILAPREIRVYASEDGREWTLVADKHFVMEPRETGMRLRNYALALDGTVKCRMIRVVVPNPGPLPEWHTAPGQPSYLFTDEIVVR